MLKAIAVTFIIFAILFAGIISLKRSANHWKIPKGVKAQPYDDDETEESDKKNSDNINETPQLDDQSYSTKNTDSKDTDFPDTDSQDKH